MVDNKTIPSPVSWVLKQAVKVLSPQVQQGRNNESWQDNFAILLHFLVHDFQHEMLLWQYTVYLESK